MANSQSPARIKIGDTVEVVSGPAFSPLAGKGGRASRVRGTVEEITPHAEGAEVMVRVASGGLWGFQADNLKVVRVGPQSRGN